MDKRTPALKSGVIMSRNSVEINPNRFTSTGVGETGDGGVGVREREGGRKREREKERERTGTLIEHNRNAICKIPN